ncbi:MAG: mandelate racemase/muconate lactonizing enzyme family protein [Gemmatimonadetes bacterium]|nr:mandelate racemase/muconate lactonizing enzyme family protein [Gemmatimonadota bacterium]
MTITELRAATVVVPLDQEAAIAKRAITERHYCLVRARNRTGIEGIGFCYVGSLGGRLATVAVTDLLRDKVVGRDPHQVEAIWDDMFHDTLLHGRRGSVLRAISAIDIALWDLMAKEAGLPLYRLLGACREETVPAYASGGYFKPGKTVQDLADEVRGYADRGFRAVKIKIGRVPVDEDVARIRACREAIGPNVQLFTDANNAWRDVPTAIRAIRAFEESGVDWLEEPVPPDDIEASAAVARAVNVPIATGEIEATRWGFQALIQAGAASILQPDAAVCGGITEWRRIAALAAGHGIPVAPHWFADLHVHLVASTPNATWVEYFPDTKVLNFMRLLKSSLEVVGGDLVLPKVPGLGIELCEEAVSRHIVDGWL